MLCFKNPCAPRTVQAITVTVLLRFLQVRRRREHLDQEELGLASGPFGCRSFDERLHIRHRGDVRSERCLCTRRLQHFNLFERRRRNYQWCLERGRVAMLAFLYFGCCVSTQSCSAVIDAHDKHHALHLVPGTRRRAHPSQR